MKSILSKIAAVAIGVGIVFSSQSAAIAQPQTEIVPTVRNQAFRLTSANPTLAELTKQVDFLVRSNAPLDEKAAQLEGGRAAATVIDSVYHLGIYMPPRGWYRLSKPVTHTKNQHTATLDCGSAGIPNIHMTVVWKRINGVWKMANKSVCEGARASGINTKCDF